MPSDETLCTRIEDNILNMSAEIDRFHARIAVMEDRAEQTAEDLRNAQSEFDLLRTVSSVPTRPVSGPLSPVVTGVSLLAAATASREIASLENKVQALQHRLDTERREIQSLASRIDQLDSNIRQSQSDFGQLACTSLGFSHDVMNT